MAQGYCGKIIRVNLSENSIRIEEPGDDFYRKYLGGTGLIGYYLLKEVPAGIDAYDKANKLVLATGIMTGVSVSGMSRVIAGAKSPLTGGFGHSEAGGFWGTELKKAGYDAVVVDGKASRPCYLLVNDDKIEVRDAAQLWGRETGETEDMIKEELQDSRVRVLQIGPAGENLVRYACIINDLKNAYGRNGLGAVMGSKNLKAIVVKGSRKISFADEKTIIDIAKRYVEKYLSHPLAKGLHDYGTVGSLKGFNAGGILPTKNFLYGEFKQVDKIDGETYKNTIFKRRHGCFGCAIQCKRMVEVDQDGLKVDSRYGGPEYETVASFGSVCEISDLAVIAKAHELCNRLGLDTISTGMTLAFVMECFERNIISEKDFDGIRLSFGSSETLLDIIKKIAYREGVGNLLAEGSLRAARKIGPEAVEICQCVKGQELPMHEPRGKVGVGIGYAVSPTGAEHMAAGHDTLYHTEGIIAGRLEPLGIKEPVSPFDLGWKKVRAFTDLHQLWSFFDMAGICKFGPTPRGSLPLEDLLVLIRASTGWEVTLWEALKAGERALSMARHFNVREGFSRTDDTLPQRLFEPLQKGSLTGKYIDKDDFDQAVLLYYEMMGWSPEGKPTAAKLRELELDWLADK